MGAWEGLAGESGKNLQGPLKLWECRTGPSPVSHVSSRSLPGARSLPESARMSPVTSGWGHRGPPVEPTETGFPGDGKEGVRAETSGRQPPKCPQRLSAPRAQTVFAGMRLKPAQPRSPLRLGGRWTPGQKSLVPTMGPHLDRGHRLLYRGPRASPLSLRVALVLCSAKPPTSKGRRARPRARCGCPHPHLPGLFLRGPSGMGASGPAQKGQSPFAGRGGGHTPAQRAHASPSQHPARLFLNRSEQEVGKGGPEQGLHQEAGAKGVRDAGDAAISSDPADQPLEAPQPGRSRNSLCTTGPSRTIPPVSPQAAVGTSHPCQWGTLPGVIWVEV